MSRLGTYIADILTGAWSLIAGMGVTIRYMFKPVATVQYPRDRLPLPDAFRGHIELVREGRRPQMRGLRRMLSHLPQRGDQGAGP
jgi:hypothetical protein